MAPLRGIRWEARAWQLRSCTGSSGDKRSRTCQRCGNRAQVRLGELADRR
jgi:hypothetical protein